VQYIGETNAFGRRLRQFGDSAGLFGVRRRGHSAGWRWQNGARKHLQVAFFPVAAPLGQIHLAIGLRKWLEAVALEEHRLAHGRLPVVNQLTPSGD
jgi:hypothetical protein